MTDIQQLISPITSSAFEAGTNKIFIKREDLIPYYFGGNKVRFADMFIQDMDAKGKNCLIAYGNNRSNLIRVLSNICAGRNIPCCMIIGDDGQSNPDSYNDLMSRSFGVQFVDCTKQNVAKTISKTIQDYKEKGLDPYYIYGNEYGIGNEAVPVLAYANVYEHILYQEKQSGMQFDYIFLASSTGITQAGLIGGKIRGHGLHKIVGISTARLSDTQLPILKKYIHAYLHQHRQLIKTDVETDEETTAHICFVDRHLGLGYGHFGKSIAGTIKEMLRVDGIALDPVYTGKAFYGMTKYIEESNVAGKNILFVHTGGTSLFYDHIRQILS
jgi:D-cysteine desulfhydrase